MSAETNKVDDVELATWATVIVSKGRGPTRQHLLAGYIGPRKDGQRVFAHPDGTIAGTFAHRELRGRRLTITVLAYRRMDLTYRAPTEDEIARRHRG